MRPLHHQDALRLAGERAQLLRRDWPRPLALRPAVASRLLQLAVWIDPPRPRPGRVTGRAVRR